jgi:tetratricopeptide (TPR) repeat protein
MATPLELVGERAADEHMRAAQRHARRGEKSDAVRAYLAAGSAFLHEETDTANARKAYEAAAAIDPTNLDAAFQVGRTDMIEGRLTDALAKFVHVIERSNQTHVPALFEAACIYQELGRVDRAILTFRKVLDRDRTNVQAIVNVGRHLQSMGMRPEALGYYVRAAETAFDAGQLGTCRQLLSLVLAIDPLHAKGRTMLLDLNEAKAGFMRPAPEPELPEGIPEIAPAPEPDPRIELQAQADAADAKLRGERDSLKREIEALAMAKAAIEVELAAGRARRDCAVSELTEIYKAIDPHRPEQSAPASAPPAAAASVAAPRAKKAPARKAKAPKASSTRSKS